MNITPAHDDNLQSIESDNLVRPSQCRTYAQTQPVMRARRMKVLCQHMECWRGRLPIVTLTASAAIGLVYFLSTVILMLTPGAEIRPA